MELVYKNMYDILDREGLEPIEAVGREFDPNLHEALMQVESDEHPEGTVVQEMTKGYKLGGKVIRHSRVSVSRGKTEDEKKDDE
jgi:molecular chaperone GrpE